jgi:hypothetical protein
MSNAPKLAPDAALALGIAATAIPFARTREDEAERWLRVLRLHGETGAALQALGVSEQALSPGTAETERNVASEHAGTAQADVIALVGERAAAFAAERGSDCVSTKEVLLAVLDVYGDVFERTLRAHGTDSDEVLERLAA